MGQSKKKKAIALNYSLNGFSHFPLPSLRDVWLCKICSETREMWKKTGAWFFKGIPRYELPQRAPSMRSSMRDFRSRPERVRKPCIRVKDSSSEDDEDEVDAPKSVCGSLDASTGASKRNDLNFLHRINSMRLHSGASNSTPNISDESYSYKKTPHLHPFNRQQSAVSCDNPSNFPSYQSQQQQQQQYSDYDTDSACSTSAKLRDSNFGQSSNSLIRCGSVSSTYSMSETSSINSSNLTNGTINSLIANQMCREPPLGWLELSLLYTEAEHSLDCSLLRARDLPAMDLTSLADPYCKLNLVNTVYGTPKQKKWIQTKTVHKTRSPEFNETIRFFGVEPDELDVSMLYVVILDEDKYGSDFLGTAKIQLRPVSQMPSVW